MTDLGVAHLSGRQADRLARCSQRRVREALPEPVEDRRRGQPDRVSRPGRSTAPPVQDHERYERVTHASAALQMAAKDSRSSEDPPTSAPSTSGSASSAAALSGLTEPP